MTTNSFQEFPFKALDALINSRKEIKNTVLTTVLSDSALMDKYSDEYRATQLIKQTIDADLSPSNNVIVQMKEMLKKLYPFISTQGDEVVFNGLMNILNISDTPSNTYNRLKTALTATGFIDSRAFQQVINELNTATTYESFIQKLNSLYQALEREKTINLQNTIFDKLTDEQLMDRLQHLENDISREITRSYKALAYQTNVANEAILNNLQDIMDSQLDKDEIVFELFKLLEEAKITGASEEIIKKLEKAVDIRGRLRQHIIQLENITGTDELDLIIENNEGRINGIRINLDDLSKGILKIQPRSRLRVPPVPLGDEGNSVVKLLSYPIEKLNLEDFTTNALKEFTQVVNNNFSNEKTEGELMAIPKYKAVYEEIQKRSIESPPASESSPRRSTRKKDKKDKDKDKTPPLKIIEGKGVERKKSNDALVKRMAILIGSVKAGNTDNKYLKKELSSIIDRLLEDDLITPREHRTVFKKYIE
jgi:hypothetical protein